MIVDCQERNYVGDRDLVYQNRHCAQTVEYWVAPKIGLYTPEELQRFMMGLVPDVEPTEITDFSYSEPADCLRCGILTFDEKIGLGVTFTTVIEEITDNELVDCREFTSCKREFIDHGADVTKAYIRRILVIPFPDEAIARSFLRGHTPRSVCDILYGDSLGGVTDKGRRIPLYMRFVK